MSINKGLAKYTIAWPSYEVLRWEGAGAQPLKEWYSLETVNWLEPNWSKVVDKSTSTWDLEAQYMFILIYQQAKWQAWSSNTLAAWCKELTHWKTPLCWERLIAEGEGADRGWDGWMASSTRWTWVWANSGRWWWTGKPGMLQSTGSQRIGHDLVTEQQQQLACHKKILSWGKEKTILLNH